MTSSAMGAAGAPSTAVRGALHGLLQRTAVRFAVVGVANTAIDFGLFLGLSTAGVSVLLANTVSTTAGLLFSYFANRRFTFRVDRRHDLRGVLLFLGVTGVGLWALQPLVILTVAAVLPKALPAALVLGVGKAAAIGIGMVWNFTLYRALVFRRAGRERG